MTDPELKALVNRHAAELGEHFESVLILVTRAHPDDGAKTQSYERGSGNFYAQYGHAREWLAMQDEFQRAEARRRDAEGREPAT